MVDAADLVFAAKPANPQFIDLTGQRFGRLTVLGFAERDEHHSWWWCRCDCGQIKRPTANKLRLGKTLSCGCWRAEKSRALLTTHGMCDHPLYNCWAKMRRRCFVETDPAYTDYGGRGITVCDRWVNGADGKAGFERFVNDMGPKPTPQHSIDRRDSDGNYEPGNCRWATKAEQARNRRSNRYVEVGGARMSVAEACDRLGLSYAIVNDRLQKGWSFERAISQAVRRSPCRSSV